MLPLNQKVKTETSTKNSKLTDMKKIFNIIVAIVAMATSAFAQTDDIYGTGTIDKNTVAANYAKDANGRMIQKTLAVMTPEQKLLAVKSLNEYNKVGKWVTGTIAVTDLEAFMSGSEIMYGNEISGPVMAYEFNDDGYGQKSYRIFLDPNDKLIAFGRVPYIQIKGKHPFTAPEPLVVNTKMPPAIVKAPEPVVVDPPKQPQPQTVEKPTNQQPGNTVVNIYNNSGQSGAQNNNAPWCLQCSNWSNLCNHRGNRSSNVYGEPKAYGPNGYNILGDNTNYAGYNNGYNNSSGNYGNNCGRSNGIISIFGGWVW